MKRRIVGILRREHRPLRASDGIGTVIAGGFKFGSRQKEKDNVRNDILPARLSCRWWEQGPCGNPLRPNHFTLPQPILPRQSTLPEPVRSCTADSTPRNNPAGPRRQCAAAKKCSGVNTLPCRHRALSRGADDRSPHHIQGVCGRISLKKRTLSRHLRGGADDRSLHHIRGVWTPRLTGPRLMGPAMDRARDCTRPDKHVC